MNNRGEKVQELLRETAAEFLSREAGRQSLITVTRAAVSDDLRHGVVYVSVYPESAEAPALEFANRHRAEFGKYFETRVRGVRIPRVEFALDLGEKNRQRLDELTN